MPCSVYNWRSRPGQGDRWSGAGWTSRLGGEKSHRISLALYIVLSVLLLLFFSLFSVMLNCHYPSPWVLLFFFRFFSLPHHRGQEWASGCVVLCCWLGLNHNADLHGNPSTRDLCLQLHCFLIAKDNSFILRIVCMGAS